MGCPSSVEIGDNLVFSVTTHDADTGVLTDAASPPTYRVYEDETATPILTGTMALLDGANTTGFYSESIACTTANGFESGKSYTVYITATVAGNNGGISYGFKAIDTADVILASIVEGTLDLKSVLRIFLSVLAGIAEGGGTEEVKFKDQTGLVDRVVATVDNLGNRSLVVLDGS